MTEIYLKPELMVAAKDRFAVWIAHCVECDVCRAENNRRAERQPPTPLFKAPRHRDITVYNDNLCSTGAALVVMLAKASSELWSDALWLKN